MVKKTQSIEGKNSTFLAFLHPDWFLPYTIHIKTTQTSYQSLSSYLSSTLNQRVIVPVKALPREDVVGAVQHALDESLYEAGGQVLPH